MKLATPLFLTGLLILSASGQVHGPICSWHLDPTSTMTIQWVEQVDVEVPPNQ